VTTTLEATPSRAEQGSASLPARLLELAESQPKAVALRIKELGRWREITWAAHAEAAETVGRGLMALGVKPGDRVGIVADNRPEWFVTDLAVQGIGAASVGAFVSCSAAELGSLFSRAGVKVAIAGDEEQLDKLLEVRAQTAIERIVVIDTRGIRQLDDPATSFEALESLGGAEAVGARSGNVDEWRERVRAIAPGDVATIVFTPGTTGAPKGVLLTHGNLVAASDGTVAALGLERNDEIVSTLPLAEIAERSLSLVGAMGAGCTVNFGEGGGSLLNDLREVEPTVFLGVPRLWEYLRTTVEAGLRNSGHIKTLAVRAALKRSGRSLVLDALVRRPLRRQLGLGRLRVALTATAPASPDLVEWWGPVGVGLRNAYDAAEATGLVTAMPGDDVRPGTAGRALPAVEVRVDGDVQGQGEILVRGATVCAGYVDGDAVSTNDGWLRTGDVGTVDGDGFVQIVGRDEELIATAGAARVAPSALEHRLEASPYVLMAVVVGAGRPHPGALVVIDSGAVGDWAASNDVPYTTFESLTERPEVRALIGECIDEVNAGLEAAERIGCFVLLTSTLTHEDGALTATFKIRRAATEQRHAAAIDEMYGGAR